MCQLNTQDVLIIIGQLRTSVVVIYVAMIWYVAAIYIGIASK